MDDTQAPSVADAPERHRYEISVDGVSAGFTAYVDVDTQRVFYHTVIDDAFGGRGLAGVLANGALTDVRAQGKRIVALCPYIAKYVSKHHDFDDILDPVTPELIAAVRQHGAHE